ncbi:MAG: hypothetical protein WA151_18555 [Desulfatirhabdiaceae bacterium]
MKIPILFIVTLCAFSVVNPAGAAQADSPELFLNYCQNLGKEAIAGSRQVIPGQDGWLFLTGEITHLGKKRFWGPDAISTGASSKPEQRDPLPGILNFADQLKNAGIHLFLVPVPPKAVIYSEKLMTDLKDAGISDRMDPYHEAFYALLKDKGVDVLDLTPIFLKEKNLKKEPLYCRTDTHWSGTGCEVAAHAVSERILSRGILEVIKPNNMTANRKPVEIVGDLIRLLNPANSGKETLSLRFITGMQNNKASQLTPDSGSPVLILADSHGLVFHAGADMHAEGAGFFDQLSYELGQPVDLIAVRGSGATPARINLMRRAQKDPDYLKQKKIIVWCFSSREFTESDGWRIVPMPM